MTPPATSDGRVAAEKLLELAEACEKASEPDRELDRDIAQAVDGPMWKRQKFPPHYTCSLDAAMTLVKYDGGCRRELAWTDNGAECTLIVVPPADAPASARTVRYTAEADTPALALTAAALRARAEGVRHDG